MRSRAPVCFALAACVIAQAAQAQVSRERDPTASTSKAAVRGGSSPRVVVADIHETGRRVIVLTNEFRRQQNLPATGPAPQLASAARYFADYMARTGKFSHSADGSEPAARAKRFGYEYCIVAENIARISNSDGITTGELADRLVTGWVNSPEHRENMVNPNVTETAVAIARSGETDQYYAVQLFGRPRSQSIQFTVANRSGGTVEYALDGRKFELSARTTSTHQVCKRSALEFRGKTLQPQHGQQLVIVNDQNGLELQAQ